MPTNPAGDPNVSIGVVDLSEAIAHAEGFGLAGAIPTRANNPGDLVMPGWKGATLGAEGITVFPTAEDGWAALYRQITLIATRRSHVYTPDMSFADMAERYTSTQRPEWAANVVSHLVTHGYEWLTVDAPLSDVIG